MNKDFDCANCARQVVQALRQAHTAFNRAAACRE